jgi:hypothetical protein
LYNIFRLVCVTLDARCTSSPEPARLPDPSRLALFCRGFQQAETAIELAKRRGHDLAYRIGQQNWSLAAFILLTILPVIACTSS